ncbi:MAG: hypothetical protein ABIR24_02635, partial [Verrucomicrobiota bacterium]
GDKTFLVEPELIPFFFDGLRLVGFWNLGHIFKNQRRIEHGSKVESEDKIRRVARSKRPYGQRLN